MVDQRYVKNDPNSIIDHLLEECGEVVSMIGKCRRFGFNNVYECEKNKFKLTNFELLEEEVRDLREVIRRFREYNVKGFFTN